jgi:hypothetical protein
LDCYYSQVRYVGPGNHTYVRGAEASSQPQFRVGDSVTVYYDPRAPQIALVYGADTDEGEWAAIFVGYFVIVLMNPWPLVWRLVRQRWGAMRARLHSGLGAEHRTLAALHHLGGTCLVWDAYRGRGGALEIRGLHLEDRAGKPVVIDRADPICKEGAAMLANRYSTEPGHYVLALPTGTVISAPSPLPAVEPEPTPPQAPLPAQPERTAESLAKEPSPLEQVMVGALLALLADAVLLVVVVLLTGSLVQPRLL